MHQRISGMSYESDTIYPTNINKLTQASVIVVVLSSTVTVSVFADRLHVSKLARAIAA